MGRIAKLLVLLVVASPAWAAEGEKSLRDFLATSEALRQIAQPDSEAWEIPEEAAHLYGRSLDELGAALTDSLSQEEQPGLSAAGLEAALRQKLGPALAATRPEQGPYGGLNSLAVRLDGDLVTVIAEPAVGLSGDRAVFLFRRQAGGKLASAGRFTALEATKLFDDQEGPPLAEIGDLVPTLVFGLGQGETPFLVVAYYPLQQISTWHALRWAVLATDGSGKILAKGEDSMQVENDPVFELKTSAQGFQLEYATHQGLDSGYWTRDVRRRFTVRGAKVSEEGSGATEPRGFVAAWGQAEAEKAAAWSQAEAMAAHARLHAALGGMITEYGSAWVDACPPQDHRWLIEVKMEPYEGDHGAPHQTLYFTVEPNGDDFRMLAAGAEKPPLGKLRELAGCPEKE